MSPPIRPVATGTAISTTANSDKRFEQPATRSCLQKVTNEFKCLTGHDRKRRLRLRTTLELMNVSSGGKSSYADDAGHGHCAVVSPRLRTVDLTFAHDLRAAQVVAARKALVTDPEFKLLFEEAISVIGRGAKGSRRLHVHFAVVLRQRVEEHTLRAALSRLTRKHGFGWRLSSQPLRSVENLGVYLANNAADASLPKATRSIWISPAANRVGSRFSWSGGVSQKMRRWLSQLAAEVGVSDEEEFRADLGPNWHGKLTHQFQLTLVGHPFSEVLNWYPNKKRKPMIPVGATG